MNFKTFYGLLVLCLFSSLININKAFSQENNLKSEKINWSGDFRYRFQSVLEDSKRQRTIQRLQGKLTLEANPNDESKVFLQFLTGTGSTSGNQSIGDSDSPGMPRRSFGLNLLYFESQLPFNAKLIGGKMPIPFYFVGKHQIILDKDISPEGLAIKTDFLISENGKFKINLGHFQIKERYDNLFNVDLTDVQLNGLQTQFEIKLERYILNLNYGIYSFISLRDESPAVTGNAGKTNTDSHYNTTDLNGNYPTNFDIRDQGIELKVNLGEGIGNIHFAIGQSNNLDVSTLNKAAIQTISYQNGFWTLSFQNVKIEKDAVVGAFMDSDFNNGNTSTSGSILSVNFKINPESQFVLSNYDCKGQIESSLKRKYERTHFDYIVSF